MDVAEVMNTWILQLGYPVVHCSLDTTTNKVSVSQEHFLLDSSKKEQLPESPYGLVALLKSHRAVVELLRCVDVTQQMEGAASAYVPVLLSNPGMVLKCLSVTFLQLPVASPCQYRHD